ncbi:MAG: ZPR1-type zinc finger protein, partial [bacterium]
CGYQNSEISFGGTIQEKGERLSLNCSSFEDLNRQIIKSDSCTIYIPSIELEIPPDTQRGVISTLEVSMVSFQIGPQATGLCCLFFFFQRKKNQCNK